MNYSRFLSPLAQSRKPSPIRELSKLLVTAPPNLIFLAGGVPNPELFPFKSLSLSLEDGKEIVMDNKILKTALQYTATAGYPDLLKHLQELQKRLHSPTSGIEWDIVVTNGSQDGLCKAFEMLVQPGDYMLLEEPSYAGTLSIVLYLNPNGANPTGTSISTERRLEIYRIAQDYDLLILEDDPYYFLQFGKEKSPSFLSLDTDGRVLRFDSFSKILSSGIRLGFVTGPKQLVERIALHMQVSVLHASTLSQVMVSSLFDQWQMEGFFSHVEKVTSFYKDQRDAMQAAATKHLTGLAEWNLPSGGMFLWMKCVHVEDTHPMIMQRALAKDVILLPGQAFMTNPAKPCPYMRAAFSIATPEQIETGFSKLAELIREEMELTAN